MIEESQVTVSGAGLIKGLIGNGKSNQMYEITFPKGSMGLELEPLIKSTEREIGCRIKDFYISIDHDGIDREILEKYITIGDIITHINGEDVKGRSFNIILDKLRSLKDTTKVVKFKNISASCKLLGHMTIPTCVNI